MPQGEDTMPKQLILCDCLGSQTLDRDALSKASGLSCSNVHTNLCGAETAAAAAAIQAGDCVIACGQEVALFEELAADLQAPLPDFVDLRDRAGWSDEAAQAAPKMAALLWPCGIRFGTCSLRINSPGDRTGDLSTATRLVYLLTR